MRISKNSKSINSLAVFLAFGLGIFITALWVYFFPLSYGYTQTDTAVRQTNKYKLVAPLLLCATYENTNLNETVSLDKDLTKLIQAKIAAGEVTGASVYLRTFGGQWVGVNENELYSPASLLKVPIMIAYFKTAESDPSTLKKTLRYTGAKNYNNDEYFKSPDDLAPGVYTVERLIKAMIVESDNNAERLLSENINKNDLDNVYTDLGLQLPSEATRVDFISAKQYSYFFRILYNATYLSPEYSEKALELLSASSFTFGIRSALPPGAIVADKFGERTKQYQSGIVFERELHDCGLVYATEQPYVLCIMTRGKDFKGLEDVISSVTKLVWSKTVRKTE